MRRSVVAALLLGALAVASAQSDTKSSIPKHGTGFLSCPVQINRIKCTRDNRSGFVSGIQWGSDGIDNSFFQVCSAPGNPTQNPGNGRGDQTTYDLSVLGNSNGKTSGSILAANTGRTLGQGSPKATNFFGNPTGPHNWFQVPDGDVEEVYVYPEGAPITQVIVLEAKNPFGDDFGKVPAVIFVYADNLDNGTIVLGTAVCGNPVYAEYYLDPNNQIFLDADGNTIAPPTPVKLQKSYTSPLVQPKFEPGADDVFLGALGSFYGKCRPRGVGYLGGDPNSNNQFALEKLTKVCFTPLQDIKNNVTFFDIDRLPEVNVTSTFNCTKALSPLNGEPFCTQPCAFDKKAKTSGPSASCAAAGYALATGKFAVIQTSEDGTVLEWTDKGSKDAYATTDAYSGSSKDGKQLSLVKFDGSLDDVLAESVVPMAEPEEKN